MKLTDEKLKEIRRSFLADKSVPEIAKEYKLSISYVYRLVSNEVRPNKSYRPEVKFDGNRLSAGAMQIVDFLHNEMGQSFPEVSETLANSTAFGKKTICS